MRLTPTFSLPIMLCAASLVSGLAQTPDASPAYLNPQLSPETRAHDLVARLTLEEKVGQMGSAADAVPRLHVPAYNYWNEALPPKRVRRTMKHCATATTISTTA
jgi:hypothetical protein